MGVNNFSIKSTVDVHMVILQVNKECEVMMEQLEVKVTRETEVILVPKEI